MTNPATRWVDRRARDKLGNLLGVVVDVYHDPTTRRPAWLAISTGFFGTRIAVAPLSGVSLLGDDVVIPYTRHTITSAPHVDVTVVVDPDQQQWLVDHYTPPAGTPDRTLTPPGKRDMT